MKITLQVDFKGGNIGSQQIDVIKEEVNGDTVEQCLNELIIEKPLFHKLLFTKENKLRSGMSLFVNNNLISEKPLSTTVNQGDKVYLIAGSGTPA